MKWFTGNIQDAIKLAKEKHVLFIVYIEGKDDVSVEMSSTWEDSSVENSHDSNVCVALKLEANSDACAQFSAFYPVVVVPSTYYIANNGTALEVIGGAVSQEELLQKLNKVVEIHKALLGNTAPQPPHEPVTNTPAASVTSELSSIAGNQDTSTENPPEASNASPQIPLEDKIEKAKRLLEEKKRKKAEEEKEQAKAKEAERRQLGKGLTELKKWQKEQQQKEAADEWKKEREEAKKHRELVKQQIARDRAERSAKFHKEKEEREKVNTEKEEAKVKAQAEEQTKQNAIKRETARLQFRLPDGSSVTEQFASSETLGGARVYLRAKIPFSAFTLSTLYPKRDFTEGDMSSTLLDLNLAPSAVIIVIPSSRSSQLSSGGGGGGGLVWMLLAPLLAIWNLLYNFVFATPPQSPQQQQQQQQQQQPRHSAAEPAAAAARPQQAAPGSATYPRQRPKSYVLHHTHHWLWTSLQDACAFIPTSYGVRHRQEGNIHRFSADDDDDDMSTWNGNSTQQM